MSDIDQRQRDYARMIVENTDWSEAMPVYQVSGFNVYTTSKLDFRIYVMDVQRDAMFMGTRTWSCLTAAGFTAVYNLVQREQEYVSSGVKVIPWHDDDLALGLKRLGWEAPRDLVASLVEEANLLLMQAAVVNEADREEWYKVFATEYARIREQADALSEGMRRLEAVLGLAESTIIDVIDVNAA